MSPNAVTEPVFGSVVESPTLFQECWASVNFQTGVEMLRHGQVQAQIDAVFRTRQFIPGVTPDKWIRYQEHEYDIVSVSELPRRVGLEIAAKRRGGSGGGV